ncbi:MAG: DUF2585 family protein, partial [Novosphingobium sp.]
KISRKSDDHPDPSCLRSPSRHGHDKIRQFFEVSGWMIVGFLVAGRIPVWASVMIAIGFELFTLAMIRDNLTLNVLMLVWPVDAVRDWQAMG